MTKQCSKTTQNMMLMMKYNDEMNYVHIGCRVILRPNSAYVRALKCLNKLGLGQIDLEYIVRSYTFSKKIVGFQLEIVGG